MGKKFWCLYRHSELSWQHMLTYHQTWSSSLGLWWLCCFVMSLLFCCCCCLCWCSVNLFQGRVILSNKTARTVAFFYTLMLHCLVFLVSHMILGLHCPAQLMLSCCFKCFACVCDQVLYKVAWSESIGRDCAAFCAKKWVFLLCTSFLNDIWSNEFLVLNHCVFTSIVFNACVFWITHTLFPPTDTQTTCTVSTRMETRGSSGFYPLERAVHINHILYLWHENHSLSFNYWY